MTAHLLVFVALVCLCLWSSVGSSRDNLTVVVGIRLKKQKSILTSFPETLPEFGSFRESDSKIFNAGIDNGNQHLAV